jgi:hypothetical protein
MVDHQQDALPCGGGVGCDDAANVETALTILTELANIEAFVFQRDLCTPQACDAFEVNRVNRSCCKGVVSSTKPRAALAHVPVHLSHSPFVPHPTLRAPPLPARTFLTPPAPSRT